MTGYLNMLISFIFIQDLSHSIHIILYVHLKTRFKLARWVSFETIIDMYS